VPFCILFCLKNLYFGLNYRLRLILIIKTSHSPSGFVVLFLIYFFREEAALAARAAAVRRENYHIGRHNLAQRSMASHAESERIFQTLLIDIVRDHDMPFEMASSEIERDSRFSYIKLNEEDKIRLFLEHCSNLEKKRISGFQSVISELMDRAGGKENGGAEGGPFDIDFESSLPILLHDPRVTRLSSDPDVLKRYYDTYMESCIRTAKEELEQALKENNFISFHIKRAVVAGQAAELEESTLKPKEDPMKIDQDEDAKNLAVSRKVWEGINLDEIREVLKVKWSFFCFVFLFIIIFVWYL